VPGEGFIVGLGTLELLEGNHSLIRKIDVLESGSVPQLHNGIYKITNRIVFLGRIEIQF